MMATIRISKLIIDDCNEIYTALEACDTTLERLNFVFCANLNSFEVFLLPSFICVIPLDRLL